MATCDREENLVQIRTPGDFGFAILACSLVLLFPSTTKPDYDGYSRPYSPQELHRAIHWYAKQYRLDSALLHAVIKAESDFDASAVSAKGALGLMQLMPHTAASLRVGDPFDPLQNIRAGTKHLRRLLNRYHGHLPLTLAAYNAGMHRVQGSHVPQIRETRAYVRKVLRYYKVFGAKQRHGTTTHPLASRQTERRPPR